MLFEKFFKIIKKSLQNQSRHTRDSYVIYIKCSFSALLSSLFSPAARSSATSTIIEDAKRCTAKRKTQEDFSPWVWLRL
jgi:hypothetical protein